MADERTVQEQIIDELGIIIGKKKGVRLGALINKAVTHKHLGIKKNLNDVSDKKMLISLKEFNSVIARKGTSIIPSDEELLVGEQ